MKRLSPLLLLLLIAGCTGDFDQRVDIARKIGAGGASIGSTTNPAAGTFITGQISTGGVVRDALVTLRRVRDDGQIDLDDNNALGVSVSLSNGAYQVNLRDNSYRGAIVVEVRGRNINGIQSTGANPATAVSNLTHIMRDDHVLWTVAPNYEGRSIFGVQVTPLTTFAVRRGEFLGGVSAGMFGLCSQQTAEFFGLPRIREGVPTDFCGTVSFGNDFSYGCVMAALSQVAANAGIANVWDFYLGMAQDGRDDGILNGSIGFVPNTGVVMPNLSAANLIGQAFEDDFLAPINPERSGVAFDNTFATPGTELRILIDHLNTSRNINNYSRTYEHIVRVPEFIELVRGQVYPTHFLAIDQIDVPIFEAYGDSGGPCFVDFDFTSSAPGSVDVLPFGRIAVDAGAAPGFYTLTLTVSPASAQVFVDGPTQTFTIGVQVR
ncbi:MAG: hypothetical protein IT462_12895 [Planctomycetes bacterium]|nr:hypothetical protein [Planctomycetota bacterium]